MPHTLQDERKRAQRGGSTRGRLKNRAAPRKTRKAVGRPAALANTLTPGVLPIGARQAIAAQDSTALGSAGGAGLPGGLGTTGLGGAAVRRRLRGGAGPATAGASPFLGIGADLLLGLGGRALASNRLGLGTSGADLSLEQSILNQAALFPTFAKSPLASRASNRLGLDRSGAGLAGIDRPGFGQVDVGPQVSAIADPRPPFRQGGLRAGRSPFAREQEAGVLAKRSAEDVLGEEPPAGKTNRTLLDIFLAERADTRATQAADTQSLIEQRFRSNRNRAARAAQPVLGPFPDVSPVEEEDFDEEAAEARAAPVLARIRGEAASRLGRRQLEAASAGDPELASAFAQAGRPGATPTVRSLETIREDFFGGPRRTGGAAGQLPSPTSVGGALAFMEGIRGLADGGGQTLARTGGRRFERPEFTEEKARRRHNLQAKRLGVKPEDLAISQAIERGDPLTPAQQQRVDRKLSPAERVAKSEREGREQFVSEAALERESIERGEKFKATVSAMVQLAGSEDPTVARQAQRGLAEIAGLKPGDDTGSTFISATELGTLLGEDLTRAKFIEKATVIAQGNGARSLAEAKAEATRIANLHLEKAEDRPGIFSGLFRKKSAEEIKADAEFLGSIGT